jgi:hypothetical protein
MRLQHLRQGEIMKSKKTILLLVIGLTINFIGCADNTEYRKISADEFVNKMKAAWIGQMIGVGWGAPTEFRFVGETIPDYEVPEFNSEMVNMYEQDDLYVEMTFIRTLEEYGIDCSIEQAGIDFANSVYMLWGANAIGRENLRSGIKPPASSHPDYHKGADWIDYQIEADYSGIISPGLPNEVIALGNKFGRIMNYGDGVYGGIFVGGMYSEAYFEDDIQEIVQAGLDCIPYESQYAECIRDVVKWYKENPKDWKKTWQLIENKYHKNPKYQKYKAVEPDYWIEMDAKLNGAYIVMGLLYGDGDPDKTITVSMQCGRDSDCNPSNAAGVLFTSIGYDNLDKKYTVNLNEKTKFSYTNYNFPELTQVSLKLAKELITRNGGKIEKDSKGKEYFLIPKIKPKPGNLEQSWDPVPYSGETKFIKEEMSRIKFSSSKSFAPLLKKWGSDSFKIYHNSSATKPEFIPWKGENEVIKTTLQNEKYPVLIIGNVSIPEGKKSHLSRRVSCEDNGEWEVERILEEVLDLKSIIKEKINAKTINNGWKNIQYDLTKYAGTEMEIQIRQTASEIQKSHAYWNKIKIVSE